MIRRGEKVDKILKNSRSIILISNRHTDSLDDYKRIIHNFSRLYPDRNITLINVYSNGNSRVSNETLYTSVAATSKKKSKNIKNKNKIQLEKQQKKKKRKKLKIIQYSFNDASSSWEGNPSAWQQVMYDIELTDRNFNKNMNFSEVEF